MPVFDWLQRRRKRDGWATQEAERLVAEYADQAAAFIEARCRDPNLSESDKAAILGLRRPIETRLKNGGRTTRFVKR